MGNKLSSMDEKKRLREIRDERESNGRPPMHHERARDIFDRAANTVFVTEDNHQKCIDEIRLTKDSIHSDRDIVTRGLNNNRYDQETLFWVNELVSSLEHIVGREKALPTLTKKKLVAKRTFEGRPLTKHPGYSSERYK